ncbi:MAG: extracellular solute-binding protein, partial [Chloroflexota bacterium]
SSAGEAGGAAAKPAQAAPQHVEVWWPYGDTNVSVRPAWDDFLRRHPGWTGELTMSVNFEKYQTSLAAGIVPDAYWSNFNVVLVAAFKKMFVPLDPYIARDKVDLKQYFPSAVIGAQWKGKTYGLPHHSNVRSVYLNANVLREVGIDAQRAPAGWDIFLAANQVLKRSDAQGGLDRIGYHPTWQLGGPTPLMYLQANGVPLIDKAGTGPGFDTPAGLQAIEWVGAAVAALGGMAALSAYQKKFNRGVGEALARNAAGMALAGVWSVARDTLQAEPNTPIVQWPMPGGPNAQSKSFGYFSGTSGVVPASAPRPEAGWAFTWYQASKEGQRYIQETPNSWDQACIPSVANDPAVLEQQPWRRRANELLAQARLYAYFPYPGSAEIQGAMNQALTPLLEGKQGPDATMRETKLQAQNVMNEYQE